MRGRHDVDAVTCHRSIAAAKRHNNADSFFDRRFKLSWNRIVVRPERRGGKHNPRRQPVVLIIQLPGIWLGVKE